MDAGTIESNTDDTRMAFWANPTPRGTTGSANRSHNLLITIKLYAFAQRTDLLSCPRTMLLSSHQQKSSVASLLEYTAVRGPSSSASNQRFDHTDKSLAASSCNLSSTRATHMGPHEPKEVHQPERISSRLVECERGQSGE